MPSMWIPYLVQDQDQAMYVLNIALNIARENSVVVLAIDSEAADGD